jgi:hypothetical protein
MIELLTLAAIAAAIYGTLCILGVTRAQEKSVAGERVLCRCCDRPVMKDDAVCEECWANRNSW